jgi:DNA-binding Lrp family transcriptional regulator
MIDKFILSNIYIASIIKKEPIEIIKKKTHLSEEFINDRIENMKKNGLISDDKKSLTELGRALTKRA